ncbi:MAG: DUF6240 domain-containing protein [Lachnospiraceae bacterium]
MKIYFEASQETYTKSNTSYVGQTDKQMYAPKSTKGNSGISVQLGKEDNALSQKGTYEKEELITLEELSEKAGMTNTDLQQMYMTVMSNNTSPEEFGKMLEEGYQVNDLDVETVVTILDQIKVSLAKGGTDISGFTDTLDQTTLEEILGNSGYAEALRQPLGEDAVAYMVQNDMEPTPENIFKARYSVGSYPRENREKWEEALYVQMEQIIAASGFEVNAESRAGAEFLVQHDIPLTAEKLNLYLQINPFTREIPEEELVKMVQKQVIDGKEPVKANLAETETIYEKAIRIQQDVYEISEEAVETTIEKEEPLDIRHLKKNQELLDQDARDLEVSGQETPDQKVSDWEASNQEALHQKVADRDVWNQEVEDSEGTDKELVLITAKRQLEEIRLHMTVEANLKLLRSDYQIDTVPLEKLVEELKQMEERLQAQGITEAAEVSEKIRQMSWMPADTIGKVVTRDIPFTVEALHEQGKAIQIEYDKAFRDYETMQTMPRVDLGDSIRKAFRNVDEILTGMGKEPSEENRRAVRILGYNSLEITEENLQKALDADAEVQTLFERMKPGRVLQLIRDGLDPLHTNIRELNTYFEKQESDFSEQAESYSRFLYQLDQKGDITPEERESYLGIYRLIHQVEKSDGQATGFLMANEAETTLENLLTAVRSGKRGEMDYRVDDDFGGVSSKWLGKSIVDQIQAARNRTQEIDFLQEFHKPVTLSNIAAATGVLNEETEYYKKYLGEDGEIRNAEQELMEAMTDEGSLAEGYELFAEKAGQALQEQLIQPQTSQIHVREMKSLWKQIRLNTSLAKESCFQLPIRLEEEVAMLHLTVRHQEHVARAEISLETEKYGRLEAVFEEKEDTSLRVALYSESMSGDTGELLEKVRQDLKENESMTQLSDAEIEIFQGEKAKTAQTTVSGEKNISSRELFQMAKILIQSIRKNI